MAFCGQNSMDMFLFYSVEFAFIIGGLRNSLEVVIHSAIIIALIIIIINTAFAILYVYTKRILFSAMKKSTKAWIDYVFKIVSGMTFHIKICNYNLMKEAILFA